MFLFPRMTFQAWLERSKYGSNGPDPRLRLPPQTMEKMIDMLEHLSGERGRE